MVQREPAPEGIKMDPSVAGYNQKEAVDFVPVPEGEKGGYLWYELYYGNGYRAELVRSQTLTSIVDSVFMT